MLRTNRYGVAVTFCGGVLPLLPLPGKREKSLETITSVIKIRTAPAKKVAPGRAKGASAEVK